MYFNSTYACACTGLQLFLCTLLVVHVHTFRYACAFFQLSMCTLSVDYALPQLSICMVYTCMYVYIHILQLNMCMVSFCKCAFHSVDIFTCACLHFSGLCKLVGLSDFSLQKGLATPSGAYFHAR